MIKTFTALRFIFAMMVLFSHLWPSGNRFFFEGFLGVGFFYMLSGFVLCLSYKEKLLAQTTSKREFLIARIARIYPLHFFMFMVFLLAQSLSHALSYKQIFVGGINLSLLQSFFPISSIYFSYNPVAWSISDEMFFYITFPFLLFFFKKIDIKRVILVFTALILALNLLLSEKYRHGILYINPLIRIADFIIGVYLYEIYVVLKRKKLSFALASFWEALSVFTLGILIFYSKDIPISYRYSIYYWPGMIFILLIFAFQSGVVSRILSTRPFILLGEASFSLYMTHYFIVEKIRPQLGQIISNGYVRDLSIIGICLAISIISFYYLERIGSRIVKGLFNCKNRELVSNS